MATAQAAENYKISEAWHDIYDEGYIHQFQPDPDPFRWGMLMHMHALTHVQKHLEVW